MRSTKQGGETRKTRARAAPTGVAWYHDLVLSRAQAASALSSLLLGALASGCSGATHGAGASIASTDVAKLEAGVPGAPSASSSSGGAPAPAALGDGPGWLGVEAAVLPPGEAGVLVRSVMPGSPAEKSGVALGDRILRVGTEEVSRPQDLVRVVSGHRGGERLGLALLRDGVQRLIAVVLADRPDPDEMLRLALGNGEAPAWRPLATVRGSVPATLAELRGRVVVMDFWASWCVACRMTVPTLNAWQDRYGAQGLTIVGVTMDSPEVALPASIEIGMEYPVLSDPDGETTRAYKAFALPTLFLIDRNGKIRLAQVGYSSAGLEKAETELRGLL
jgi:thiol-disulfide isomerase/thioredoxin